MSATSQFIADHLYTRSQFAKPGSKKAVKSGLSRAERRKGKLQLVGEMLQLVPPSGDLRDLSADDLELYADHLLSGSRPEDVFDEGDEFFGILTSDVSFDEPAGVPLHLQGSLPDWMLQQLEDANGDAFAALSLFEAKSPSPKAAISMADEPLYA